MSLIHRVFFVLIVTASLAACSQEELIDNLSQRDSIEVISVLNQSGIRAERVKRSRGANARYAIQVSPGDKQRATDIIHRYGFPREEGESLEALTRQHGFVPNPAQLNEVRLDRALAAELERLLGAINGVVDARVIVRSNLSNKKSATNRTTTRNRRETSPDSLARASVVVRYISSAGKQPFTDTQVKEMVANAVPGLRPDDVSVSVSRIVSPNDGGDILGGDRINPLETLEPFEFQVPNSQRDGAQRQVALVVVIVAAVGIFIGLAFGWTVSKRRTERTLRRLARPKEEDNFFIESGGGAKKPGALTSGSKN